MSKITEEARYYISELRAAKDRVEEEMDRVGYDDVNAAVDDYNTVLESVRAWVEAENIPVDNPDDLEDVPHLSIENVWLDHVDALEGLGIADDE
jgi:hypothetical protein